ncbi:unnamed protein product [Rotaria sordida]|uniref:UBA domain-containing protein n=1 Tax=Rotaria sordida TaxID=392033 RepID=A0A819E3N9_9BILA|nr:unnamed protein product [Rotaria sordida]
MAEGGPSAASATSSYSNNDVNEQFLKSLMEMGIHREDARQALRIVNNRSLEDALAVVFGESPSFFAESVTSASGASVEQATQVSYESSFLFQMISEILTADGVPKIKRDTFARKKF